jgi:hypothetical protein
MAKQGQHNQDARDPDVSRSSNTPEKSVTITAGTPKKKSTTSRSRQATEHRDTARPAQAAKPIARTDTRRANASGTRARRPRSGRSGGDSDAGSGTRGH